MRKSESLKELIEEIIDDIYFKMYLDAGLMYSDVMIENAVNAIIIAVEVCYESKCTKAKYCA